MIEGILDLFVDPFIGNQSFQKGMIGGLLVAIVCGVVGCFVILKRMAFLGDAISHSMIAGVTAGYLVMQILFNSEANATGMLVGSMLAGLFTVGMISFVSRVSRIKEDTAIGIMYTGVFAGGSILAAVFSHRIHVDLMHFFMGSVLVIPDSYLWMMAIVSAVVLAVVILFFRHFQITTFDPVMAASIGIPVVVFDYLLTTCTSLVVISAVNIVGIILVVGLLVTPAATAYLLCDRLSRMMLVSAAFGCSSVIGGMYIACWVGNIFVGPSIVAFGTLQFLFVLAVAPRYGLIAGWLRRRSMVPQQIVEDVLGCFRYRRNGTATVTQIASAIGKSQERTRKALRSLQRQDLLQSDGNSFQLTKSGRREAKRLLRAHRLWETYLQHVGVPEEQLHTHADLLEHVHDEETVDYLDDVLGHPTHDPHGAEIPEDFVHLVPGAIVKASLLREGRSAVVVSIPDSLSEFGIVAGDTITAGVRSDDNKYWTFTAASGETIQLDHAQADMVDVEVLD
ncbi:MAG: metal ABC transporter permease [Planctomycetales bacterium]|nr:metal ABC transporter permease [Planctomycetales bacterium]